MASKLKGRKAFDLDPDSESSFEVIDMDTSFSSRPGDFKFNAFSQNSSFNQNFNKSSAHARPGNFPQPLT